MGSGVTSKYGLAYPLPSDPPAEPSDIEALANGLDALIAAAVQGTAAARPAFGKSGRLYYATDTQVLSYDTGSAWVGLGLVNGSGSQIAPIVPGQSASAGATGMAADAAHIHAAPAFSGTGDITPASPGQSVVAGSSGRFADGAHKHSTPAWGASGDIASLAFGGAATAGSSGKYADAGHTHAMPAPPVTSPLAVMRYAPTTMQSFNGSGAALAAVSSSTLTVSFTAPASGRVLVRLAAFLEAGGTSDNVFWFGLVTHGTSAQVGDVVRVSASSMTQATFNADIYVTGLTASTTYAWDFAVAGDGQGGNPIVIAASPTPGYTAMGAPILMIVTAA